MQRTVPNGDPWLHAVGMLKRLNTYAMQHSEPENVQCSTSLFLRKKAASQNNTIVKVLDKPTNTTATVAWFDSTSCRYGDQRWTLRVARSNGICALTGEPVKKGDRVYQPRTTGHRPLNANEMILSSVLGFTKTSDAIETHGFVERFERECEPA